MRSVPVAAVGGLLSALALALAPAAGAGGTRASVTVQPATFSPHHGQVEIAAVLADRAPLGLQVVTRAGKPVGWLAREVPRARLDLTWGGRVAGRKLADGAYLVRLQSRGKTVAQTEVRVDTTAPLVTGVRVASGPLPYAGDGQLLATVSPNGDGVRDAADISFVLSEPSTVHLEVDRTVKSPTAVWAERLELPAGRVTIPWTPPADLGPRTYIVRLTAVDAAGNARTIGRSSISGRERPGPVVRVQGVDAAFSDISSPPGATATLRIATDAAGFTVQLFRVGADEVVSLPDNAMAGQPVSAPVAIDWSAHRDAPGTVRVGVPPALASGLYYAQLTARDGRIGYAPLVVRPTLLGRHRIAVVIPTNTWQAYNFQDVDGDGWGDTWYAGGPPPPVRLHRPFLRRGVPQFFRRYDLPFQHWLVEHGLQDSVDTISDDELDASTGAGLALAYDLIVFPAHTEYVTEHERNALDGFRDRGGNLIFLSANSIFWRVDRSGDAIRRVRQWRELGRPESALLGVQYRGNDEGTRQAPFVVRDTTATPWLWEGTGLTTGSLLGGEIGGYGTEIDATTAASPPGTVVLAEIPNLFGPGLTAQMAYYETPAGAKVFSAGALDFGGSVMHQPQDRLLLNLWNRLSLP